MSKKGEKTILLIISILLILIIPFSSAVLTAADSTASSSIMWLMFAIGLVIGLVGFWVFHMRTVWFIGAFFMGMGLILILYSLNTALALAAEVGTFAGLAGKTNLFWGKIANSFKYLTWLVIVGFVYWIYHLYGSRKEKKSADGWDGNK